MGEKLEKVISSNEIGNQFNLDKTFNENHSFSSAFPRPTLQRGCLSILSCAKTYFLFPM